MMSNPIAPTTPPMGISQAGVEGRRRRIAQIMPAKTVMMKTKMGYNQGGSIKKQFTASCLENSEVFPS